MKRITSTLFVVITIAIVVGPWVSAQTLFLGGEWKNSQEVLDKRIEGPVIARNQDLGVIIQMLQAESGMQYVLDEGINKQVTFSLDNPTVLSVLNTMLPPLGLVFMVTDEGVVRIGTAESIEALKHSQKSTRVNQEAIRKSLTVMSNVLDYMLKERLGEDYQARSFFSKGTRGYWIPGSGVVFMLGVKFPLIQPEKPKENPKENGKQDLWDEFEEKLSSGKPIDFPFDQGETKRHISISNVTRMKDRNAEFDAKKVEIMRETVLEALAKYGNRLEGFKPEETLTVVVEGEGRDPIFGKISLNPGIATGVATSYQSANHSIDITNDQPAPISEKIYSEVVVGTVVDDFAQPENLSELEKNGEKSEMDKPEPSSGVKTQSIKLKTAGVSPSSGNAYYGMNLNQESVEMQIAKKENELRSYEEILDTRRKDMDVIQREVEIAREKLAVTKQAFETGTLDQKTVLDAEKQTIEAQKSLNEAQRQMIEVQNKFQNMKVELENLHKSKQELKRMEERLEAMKDQQDANKTIGESITNFQYPWNAVDWNPVDNRVSPVMVIQIKFGDLPEEEGSVEAIKGKVSITTY